MDDSMRSPNGVPVFIDPPDGYRCIICASVLRNAMQLPCGHLLCETPCVDVLFDNKEEAICPTKEEDCLEPFKKPEVYKDRFCRRVVLMLEVQCPYRIRGCKEQFPWKFQNKHIAECQFRLVPCPNEGCNDQISANQLEEHRLEICLYRPVNCEYCGQTIPKCELKNHHRDVPTPCPKKRGIGAVQWAQMTQHVTEHRGILRSCYYKSFGCTFEGLEIEVSEHEQKATDIHLKLVTQFTLASSDRYQTLVQEMETIKEERNILKKDLEDLHETNSRMREEEDKSRKDLARELKVKMVALTQRVIQLERNIENLSKKDHESHLTNFQDRIHRQERTGPVGVVENESQEPGDGMMKMTQNEERKIGLQGMKLEGDCMMKVAQNEERKLVLQDVKLAELDLRFQILETANYEGVLVWKIRDYCRLKQEAVVGKTVSLYSQPFYTSRFGYKMCAKVYLNGYGIGKETHLSLFFVVMRGEYDAVLEWPFQHSVTLMLLDQKDGKQNVHFTIKTDTTRSSFKRPKCEMNIAVGCPCFVPHADLETDTYKRDDTIIIKVKVENIQDQISVVYCCYNLVEYK